MQAKLIRIADHLTPDLARLHANANDRSGLHSAIGLGLVSLAKRAWTDPAKRPKSWPAKTNGAPATLRDTGTLAKSIRVVAATDDRVTIGSDRVYAAIHQLGGRTRAHIIRPTGGRKALRIPGIGFRKSVKHPGSNVPARPFLPFDESGRPTAQAITMIRQVTRARLLNGVKGA